MNRSRKQPTHREANRPPESRASEEVEYADPFENEADNWGEPGAPLLLNGGRKGRSTRTESSRGLSTKAPGSTTVPIEDVGLPGTPPTLRVRSASAFMIAGTVPNKWLEEAKVVQKHPHKKLPSWHVKSEYVPKNSASVSEPGSSSGAPGGSENEGASGGGASGALSATPDDDSDCEIIFLEDSRSPSPDGPSPSGGAGANSVSTSSQQRNSLGCSRIDNALAKIRALASNVAKPPPPSAGAGTESVATSHQLKKSLDICLKETPAMVLSNVRKRVRGDKAVTVPLAKHSSAPPKADERASKRLRLDPAPETPSTKNVGMRVPGKKSTNGVVELRIEAEAAVEPMASSSSKREEGVREKVVSRELPHLPALALINFNKALRQLISFDQTWTWKSAELEAIFEETVGNPERVPRILFSPPKFLLFRVVLNRLTTLLNAGYFSGKEADTVRTCADELRACMNVVEELDPMILTRPMSQGNQSERCAEEVSVPSEPSTSSAPEPVVLDDDDDDDDGIQIVDEIRTVVTAAATVEGGPSLAVSGPKLKAIRELVKVITRLPLSSVMNVLKTSKASDNATNLILTAREESKKTNEDASASSLAASLTTAALREEMKDLEDILKKVKPPAAAGVAPVAPKPANLKSKQVGRNASNEFPSTSAGPPPGLPQVRESLLNPAYMRDATSYQNQPGHNLPYQGYPPGPSTSYGQYSQSYNYGYPPSSSSGYRPPPPAPSPWSNHGMYHPPPWHLTPPRPRQFGPRGYWRNPVNTPVGSCHKGKCSVCSSEDHFWSSDRRNSGSSDCSKCGNPGIPLRRPCYDHDCPFRSQSFPAISSGSVRSASVAKPAPETAGRPGDRVTDANGCDVTCWTSRCRVCKEMAHIVHDGRPPWSVCQKCFKLGLIDISPCTHASCLRKRMEANGYDPQP